MYFETGQGSEMSVALDSVRMSRRSNPGPTAMAVLNPFCVNNVTGFIGPETHLNGQQVAFGTLEDLFCGKMHGFCMGLALVT
jgi:ethanolamine ammonia-lyase large subunit